MDDRCNIVKKYWTSHTPYDKEVEPCATQGRRRHL